MSQQDIEMLISELSCDDIIRCQTARRSLVSMGHKAVPALSEALKSSQHWVRWEAAKALSQIGDPESTNTLVRSLTDKEFDVRWIAAEGLIFIGEKAVVPLLKALATNPKSTWLREGAHHVLHDMDKGEWTEALLPVMSALEDGVPVLTVPLAAEKALDEIMENRHS
jgi:HEAT repeat protein